MKRQIKTPWPDGYARNPAVRVIRPIHPVSAFFEAAIRALALVSASPGLIDYPFLVIRKSDAAEVLRDVN